MQNDETLWRTYSRVYDEILHVIPYRSLLLEVVDRLEVKTGMRLLDAGCGTCNLLWALRQHDVQAAVTGLDFSRDMLARAATKLPNYDAPVDLLHADLNEPLESWGTSGPFDRVVLNNSIWVLQDPAQVLLNVGKIATDSAALVLSTPRPNPNVNELLEEHLSLSENLNLNREEALQRILPILQPLIQCNEQLMKRYGDNDHFPDEPHLRKWFEGSSWNIQEITSTYAGQNWLVVASKAKPA